MYYLWIVKARKYAYNFISNALVEIKGNRKKSDFWITLDFFVFERRSSSLSRSYCPLFRPWLVFNCSPVRLHLTPLLNPFYELLKGLNENKKTREGSSLVLLFAIGQGFGWFYLSLLVRAAKSSYCQTTIIHFSPFLASSK